MTREQQVAIDAMRSAWPEETVARMLRAAVCDDAAAVSWLANPEEVRRLGDLAMRGGQFGYIPCSACGQPWNQPHLDECIGVSTMITLGLWNDEDRRAQQENIEAAAILSPVKTTDGASTPQPRSGTRLPCGVCDGTGRNDFVPDFPCASCEGAGTLIVT